MNACFADTYFFLALLFQSDEAHQHANDMVRDLSGRIYTTAFVLTEVADAMAIPGRRQQFVPFLSFLRSNPMITILPPEQEIFDRGISLYDQGPDKSWSLTDCISFIVMQNHGLGDALTADHHFEQAGFNILLK